MKQETAREKLWNVFAEALVMAKGKLQGKRTSEKRIVETIIFLTQSIKKIDSIVIGEDGEVSHRSMNSIFRDCLEKDEMENGGKDPLDDERDLMKEAQNELEDAVICLARALTKIRGKRENAEEESDPLYYNIEGWIQRSLDDISSDETHLAAA